MKMQPPKGVFDIVTGATSLAFVSHELAKENLPKGFVPMERDGLPQSGEVCLVTSDPDLACKKAIEEGATEVVAPVDKPWGERVGYVRDPEGILLALASES